MESKLHKKLRKRRDLDKLLSGSDKRRGVIVHSSSEDPEAIAQLQRNVCRQSRDVLLTYPRRRFCCSGSTCWNVTVLVTLLLCIISLVGLGWLFVQLTRKLEFVQQKLYNLDHTPSQLDELTFRLMEVSRIVSHVNFELPQLESNMTELSQQLATVNATVSRIDRSVGMATELLSNPRQMKQLSKLVAELGSNVESLRQQQLSANQQVEIISRKLNNYTQVAAINTTLLQRMAEINGSLWQFIFAVNSTTWHQILNTNVTLWRQLESADRQLQADEDMKFWNWSSVQNDIINETLSSKLKEMVDKVNLLQSRINSSSSVANMTSIMDNLKASVFQLTANVTYQQKALRDIAQRLTMIELTVDDVIPSRGELINKRPLLSIAQPPVN